MTDALSSVRDTSISPSFLTCRGRPVKTEDGYHIQSVGTFQLTSQVDLVFADAVVRTGYLLKGNPHSEMRSLSYHVDHSQRTVCVREPLGLLGGMKGEKALEALTAASLAVIAKMSTPALFGIVFMETLTKEADNTGWNELLEAIQSGYRHLAERISQTIKDEFAKKTNQEILEENIVAQLNMLNYAQSPDPSYAEKALISADRTYAKIVNLATPGKARFQDLFSSVQTMRFTIHLARATIDRREFGICRDIAHDTIEWLNKAKAWEREFQDSMLVVDHTVDTQWVAGPSLPFGGHVSVPDMTFIPHIFSRFSDNIYKQGNGTKNPEELDSKKSEMAEEKRRLIELSCQNNSDKQNDKMRAIWIQMREQVEKKMAEKD